MDNNPINLDELMSSKPSEEVVDNTTNEINETDVTAENDSVVDDTTIQNDDIVDDLTEEEQQDNGEIVEEREPQPTNEIVEEEADVQEQENPLENKIELKDDFIKKVVDYYEKYGNLQPFLEATQIDYDNLGDIELLRKSFDKENADLPEKTRNKLFEKELQKYNLDSYEDDDKEIGLALLKRDANKLRKVLKDEQQQFLNSIQPQESAPQVSEAELLKQQEIQRAKVKQSIDKVVVDNFVKLESNGETFNFQVEDKNKIVDYAVDSTAFLSSFVSDGNVDWDKWSKVVAFAENPTKFIDELIKHGKSLGKKTMESELKNSTIEKVSKDVQSIDNYSHPTEDPNAFLSELRKFKK